MDKLCTLFLVLSVLLLLHLCMKKEECKVVNEKFWATVEDPLAGKLRDLNVNVNSAGYTKQELNDY